MVKFGMHDSEGHWYWLYAETKQQVGSGHDDLMLGVESLISYS